MSPPTVHVLASPDTPGEEYFLPAEKLIAGNPKQTLWQQYCEAGGRFFAGEWHSDIGKWRVSYTEEEYCQILQGVSVISDSTGSSVTVRPGDRFVMPRGFLGTWEVIEPTRKLYVIYEPGVT